MCSRIDGENLYIMVSDIVHFWETAELLQKPRHPWEFVQIGNCGSPLETPEGWLLLTHGVGPMRTYCIGAMLLDLNDPLKVIGCLDEPLITPTEKERDGYVPNVAYSCGAMIHNGQSLPPVRHVGHDYPHRDGLARFPAEPADRIARRGTGSGPARPLAHLPAGLRGDEPRQERGNRQQPPWPSTRQRAPATACTPRPPRARACETADRSACAAPRCNRRSRRHCRRGLRHRRGSRAFARQVPATRYTARSEPGDVDQSTPSERANNAVEAICSSVSPMLPTMK